MPNSRAQTYYGQNFAYSCHVFYVYSTASRNHLSEFATLETYNLIYITV